MARSHISMRIKTAWELYTFRPWHYSYPSPLTIVAKQTTVSDSATQALHAQHSCWMQMQQTMTNFGSALCLFSLGEKLAVPLTQHKWNIFFCSTLRSATNILLLLLQPLLTATGINKQGILFWKKRHFKEYYFSQFSFLTTDIPWNVLHCIVYRC